MTDTKSQDELLKSLKNHQVLENIQKMFKETKNLCNFGEISLNLNENFKKNEQEKTKFLTYKIGESLAFVVLQAVP